MMKEDKQSLPEWEGQLNALVDGELDAAGIEQLKMAARGDPEFSRAVFDAEQLRRELAALQIESAPVSLQEKLWRIPGDQKREQRRRYFKPVWLAAAAASVIAALLLDLPGEPTAEAREIARGKQDLALALAYLDRATLRASSQIALTLDDQMTLPVARNVASVLDEQLDLNKE